jgi:hypothetical protein
MRHPRGCSSRATLRSISSNRLPGPQLDRRVQLSCIALGTPPSLAHEAATHEEHVAGLSVAAIGAGISRATRPCRRDRPHRHHAVHPVRLLFIEKYRTKSPGAHRPAQRDRQPAIRTRRTLLSRPTLRPDEPKRSGWQVWKKHIRPRFTVSRHFAYPVLPFPSKP